MYRLFRSQVVRDGSRLCETNYLAQQPRRCSTYQPRSGGAFISGPTVPEDHMTECPDLDDAKLMLGAAAVILGEDHAATLALARAVTTRKAADIEAFRLALRDVPRDQRRAIAETFEAAWEAEGV